MNKYVVGAYLLLSSLVAQAEQWTETQQVLAATYLTAHTIDWAQTRSLARSTTGGKHGSGYDEENPILGRKPASDKTNAYFILTPLIGYFVLDALPEYRTPALVVLTAVEIAVIARNYRIGVKVAF
jgi:hypothetical protein